MMLLHEKLRKITDKFPQKIALVSPGTDTTFEQFQNRVDHLAGALESMGLKKGDRVSILSQNRLDYLTFHFATSMLGVILNVMNTRHVIPEWQWVLIDAQNSCLVVDESFTDVVPELKSSCPSLRYTIGIDTNENVDFTTGQLVEQQKKVQNIPHIEPEHPVLLIYTSGTTGRPKGCLQTQVGSCTIDDLTAKSIAACENDAYMAVMPYFHQAGVIRTRAIMMNGGANVLPESLEIDDIVDLMAEKKVTVTMIVSTQQALKLLDKSEKEGKGYFSLRLIISGGGMGEKGMGMMKLFCDSLECEYMGIWGQTECTGPVTVVSGGTAFENPNTCGKPMEGIELEIWNDKKVKLPIGTVGEIMVRSSMTASYWSNPEANNKLYTENWLHTGDLGRLDQDGYLYFKDRKKELIKTGGENVYPSEVERVLANHPSVSELAVIGLPDKEWGEKVTAVVVLNIGQALTLNELKAFCQGKIAGYKIPKSIHIVETIPKNQTGKTMKVKLQEQFNSYSL